MSEFFETRVVSELIMLSLRQTCQKLALSPAALSERSRCATRTQCPAPLRCVVSTQTRSYLVHRLWHAHRLRVPRQNNLYDALTQRVKGGVVAPPLWYETLKRFPPQSNIRGPKPNRLELPQQSLMKCAHVCI